MTSHYGFMLEVLLEASGENHAQQLMENIVKRIKSLEANIIDMQISEGPDDYDLVGDEKND